MVDMEKFPLEWTLESIDIVVKKIVGGGTPTRKIIEYFDGNIPWVTVKDMDGKFYKESAQEFITKEAIDKSASNLIEEGNVIIATRMGLGRGFINTKPLAINQDLKALYLKEYVNNVYFLYWYLNNSSLVESMGKGSTVKGIRLEELRKLNIPIPPLQEQKK